MKAATHTEIYRPFQGSLLRWPLRPWVIAWSGIRLGFRRKQAALLLFSLPAIAALIGAVRIHLRFVTLEQLEKGEIPEMAALALSEALGDVSKNIFDFLGIVSGFALLAISWYGSALIANDKRLGANLLYFSRPITRAGYLVGKLLAVMVFGWCSMLLPVLLICIQAGISSPDWSFFREEWDLVLRAVLFSLLWVFVFSCVVLAVSSLVNRSSLALAFIFGLVFLSSGAAEVAAGISGDARWELASLLSNFAALADAVFDQPQRFAWDVEASCWVLGLVTTASLAVLARNIKRMEVVG